MAGFSDYDHYDALGLAALVAKGDVTPAELLEEAIARTEAIDPKINAVVLRHFDLARQAIKDGLPQGPFTGVPFLLKNLTLLLKGTVTDHGCGFFRNAVADHDSTLTARYKAAGLVIFGKTNSPEFGLTVSTEPRLHGTTHNPWDLSRSPGGSSGGAAAAVAAGIVPMAQASDGGGSIRLPAACCGLFGIHPTRARTPIGPDRGENWDGMSRLHVVSRSVRDSAVLLDATTGPEPGDPYAAPPGGPFAQSAERDPAALRIGMVMDEPAGVIIAPEIRQGVEDTAALLEELGHTIEPATLPVDPMVMRAAQGTIIAGSTALTIRLRSEVLGREPEPDELEPVTRYLVEMGRSASAEDYARATHAIQAAGRAMAGLHDRFDVLLQPTTATLPPPLGRLRLDREDLEAYIAELYAFCPYTALCNMTGAPSASVPVAWTPEGFPIGMMFSADFGNDDILFSLAGQLERTQPWAFRRPSL